jgi:hypothetical protein
MSDLRVSHGEQERLNVGEQHDVVRVVLVFDLDVGSSSGPTVVQSGVLFSL